MKILKFGGTSVGSKIALLNLSKIVISEHQLDNELIVVCSAVSGVTNLLQIISQKAALQNDFQNELMEIKTIHSNLIKDVLSEKSQIEVLKNHNKLYEELQKILESVFYLKEVSPKTNDKILSFGKKFSNFLIYSLLKEYGQKTIQLNTEKVFITDSNFGNAKIDFNTTEKNIIDWYKKENIDKSIILATGFIASDTSGNTTTLGRGGSDYTASIFGATLNASEIQIWTDVNGFMTADPKWVTTAKSLMRLSYVEAMELSFFGAKVIYPPTMIPVIEKRIPICIKNTFNPDFEGTIIHHSSENSVSMAKGVASINDIALINIEGSGLVGFKGFSGRLFSSLANNGINIIMITQAGSEHSISFAVVSNDAELTKQTILKEFEFEFLIKKIETISVENNLGIVAVVGENMKYQKGIAGKTFHAIGKAGVNIIAIAQGSSELNISMVVKKNDLKKAINAIHNDLFLTDIKNAYLIVAGIGNIGKELLKQLNLQAKILEKTQNLKLNLLGISNSKKQIVNYNDINFENWEDYFNKNAVPIDFNSFILAIKDTHLPNLIFVDNTANEMIASQYKTLLDNNISVVTCNKIATTQYQEIYDDLKQTALQKNISFLYETNVGAGLPIIKTIQDLMNSGDEILKIEAILSGTLSYIFNQYTVGKSFAEVVKDAQLKGYTEPNPVDDLSGKDFARKMLILARESGFKLEMEDINIDPILPLDCLNASNLEEFYTSLNQNEIFFSSKRDQAINEGKVLRYIGTFEDNKVKLEIKPVDITHPFYGLSGSDNIIAITTKRYFLNPLVVKGPGAGANVTAAGVFADIMRAAQVF